MPKNTDPPGYHSREITHHIVGQFKNHFSGTTDAGFRCHCGHKGGVQFTDYQAMTSPVAWELPSVVCDRVIAAWRAHTKDLDGVHPNAEDQIRDFFSRQLKQPGGPTMNDAPRYPLTAIPPGTPKPKSLTISAFVDENMRRIIVDYAEKLGIVVTPVESRWFDWLVTDRPTSLESATPAAMREYLARLLYGGEGIVANLLADEKGDNPWRQMPIPSKEMRAAWEKWDCLFAEPYGKRCSLHTNVFRGNLQNFSGWGEPGRFEEFDEKNFNTNPNIFWRPNGKTWAEVEEKVKNTTVHKITPTPPSDSFANEIGRLAVEAAAQGKSTFRANVALPGPLKYTTFDIPVGPPLVPGAISPEALNDFANDPELTTKPINNDRPTRIILRSYAADDKPRIERLLGLACQLQIPVQLAGPWSCTAFPKGEEAHPALDVVFPEVLVHPRDVLILTFPNGEHIGDNGGTNLSEIENQLLWETREQDQRFITGLVELLGLPADASRGDIAAAVGRSKTSYEERDARARDILGAVDGEETDEAARRFVEAQEKVHAELGKQLEKEKRETQNRIRVETARLNNEIANLKEHADAWNCRVEKGDLRDAVSKLRGEAEQVREILDAAVRHLLATPTAITAERQTIAQRIDLALTGNAVVTNLDTMLRAVEACREGYTREASRSVNLRRDCGMLQSLIGRIADALDAPPGERSFLNDDGSLNTALVDRIVGYFKRLYTTAGYSEPPQGGWSEILSNVEDTLAGECPLPSR